MKKLIEILDRVLEEGFEKAGYDKIYGKVSVSNRPDLCEYQCNGAMAGAKAYKKAPIAIANDVVDLIKAEPIFSSIEAIAPGFININISSDAITKYINELNNDKNQGLEENKNPKTIIVDYGGPNVAKPLHVGHLRSAIIGESVKRIARKMGNKVYGDIHMGDWGYQMGLIITELHQRRPELPYFDNEFEGEYPEESPFTISELEEIYPIASKTAKEDEEYREAALAATFELQSSRRGYIALWKHILKVSVEDLKRNYANLNVDFDLWLGESDAQKYIPDMVSKMKDDGYAHEDEGALIVDIAQDSDKKELPPCIILKSDGASLYSTTDLATLVQRRVDYNPDALVYLADKRQELHFTQVFRTAKKTGIISPETSLHFLGFGTMNGKDGKPFKTRDGGIMRLESLINEIREEMLEKIMDNKSISKEEAVNTARIVSLAALKYGDLSNQASKDYIFDIERFTSFEGNTGPYILYTIVRIKSILSKYEEAGGNTIGINIKDVSNDSQKSLMLEVAKYNEVIENAYNDLAPHKICAYLYDVSNAFNKFYHETKILSEEDESKKESYISLLIVTKKILEECIDLLGFEAPDRM
ncbi:MAG: arginine--tRNA ligase [Suipraeoptans sp.]